MTEYNIYCDENCRLEHDRQPIMVIGRMWNDVVQEEIALVEERK